MYAGGIFIHSNTVNLTLDKQLNLDVIKENLIQYLIGSFALGIILAIGLGVVVYGALSIFRNKKKLQKQFVQSYND